uniref:Uncharacterized protein n=1 Tax=Amphora coffeiformis TaxID=265554 RepID=A0A7S3L7Q5_9STRA
MVVPNERSRRTSRAFRRFFPNGKRSLKRESNPVTTTTTPDTARDERHDDDEVQHHMDPILEHEEQVEERQSSALSFHVLPSHVEGDIELSIASLMGELEATNNETYTVEYFDEQSCSAVEEAYIPSKHAVEEPLDANLLVMDSFEEYCVTGKLQLQTPQPRESNNRAGSRANHQADHWKRVGSVNNKHDKAYIEALQYALQLPGLQRRASTVSRLTSQASETIYSSSETSCDDSEESTPALPGMLLLQTHSDGTKELITHSPTESEVSNISEQEENDKEESSSGEEEESGSDADSNSGEDGSDEETISDDDTETLETQRYNIQKSDSQQDGHDQIIQEDNTKEEEIQNPLAVMDVAFERIATDDDAFVDLPLDEDAKNETSGFMDLPWDDGATQETSDRDDDDTYTREEGTQYTSDGYESAYTHDDDNEVPFLEPIEPKNETSQTDGKSFSEHKKVGKEEEEDDKEDKVGSKSWLW